MKSDALTEAISWQVTTWREGKGIAFRDFRTQAEALEAAGLSEELEDGDPAARGHQKIPGFFHTGHQPAVF